MKYIQSSDWHKSVTRMIAFVLTFLVISLGGVTQNIEANENVGESQDLISTSETDVAFVDCEITGLVDGEICYDDDGESIQRVGETVTDDGEVMKSSIEFEFTVTEEHADALVESGAIDNSDIILYANTPTGDPSGGANNHYKISSILEVWYYYNSSDGLFVAHVSVPCLLQKGIAFVISQLVPALAKVKLPSAMSNQVSLGVKGALTAIGVTCSSSSYAWVHIKTKSGFSTTYGHKK